MTTDRSDAQAPARSARVRLTDEGCARCHCSARGVATRGYPLIQEVVSELGKVALGAFQTHDRYACTHSENQFGSPLTPLVLMHRVSLLSAEQPWHGRSSC